MDVERQVRVVQPHVGTVARLLAEVVGNSILHLVSHKLRVAELIAEHHRIHSKSLLIRQILLPLDGLYGIIHLFSRLGLEVLDRLQNAQCRAQTEVSAIHHLFVAGERNHSSANLYIVCSQCGKLFCQHLLQSLEGLGDEFKFHICFFTNVLHLGVKEFRSYRSSDKCFAIYLQDYCQNS